MRLPSTVGSGLASLLKDRCLRNFFVQTPAGSVVFHAETRDPAVLMIHGFKRRASQLAIWRDRIQGLGLVSLPGHGGAPDLTDISLQCWIDSFRYMIDVLPRPPLIIAESLGAILAMSLPAKAVIAVEPLLSIANLWPLHRTIRDARARGISIRAEDEALFSEPFDWVLDRISAPTMVIAGDIPLLPERPIRPEPSLLTEEDLARYRAHPLVEAARRIPGGHTLLDHNRDGVLAAANTFMARHGYFSTPPSQS